MFIGSDWSCIFNHVLLKSTVLCKVEVGGLLLSWERWTVVVFSWFGHCLVVEIIGTSALTAWLERLQNWLWRTSFRALRLLIVGVGVLCDISPVFFYGLKMPLPLISYPGPGGPLVSLWHSCLIVMVPLLKKSGPFFSRRWGVRGPKAMIFGLNTDCVKCKRYILLYYCDFIIIIKINIHWVLASMKIFTPMISLLRGEHKHYNILTAHCKWYKITVLRYYYDIMCFYIRNPFYNIFGFFFRFLPITDCVDTIPGTVLSKFQQLRGCESCLNTQISWG